MRLRQRHLGRRTTVAWLVTLARAGYGVGLVAVPGLLIGLTGERPGSRACGVARVLGVRHLAQAGITAVTLLTDPGGSVVLGGGAAVDLLHATSMVLLGAADLQVRRVSLGDAAVETALAMAGAMAAATARRGASPAGDRAGAGVKDEKTRGLAAPGLPGSVTS